MFKKATLLIILGGFSIFSFGQNDPFVSLYMFNQMYYNPGYAGDGNEIEAKILNQQRLKSFEGSPTSTFFNVDAPFNLFSQRHGAGLSIITDNIGNYSNTGLNLSYAYRRNLIQGDLGIGIGLNLISTGLNGIWSPSEMEASMDQTIPDISEEPIVLDFNFGLFYRSDNLYLSISGRNLANSKMKYKKSDGYSYIGRQIYLATGYEYQLANPMYSFKPSVAIGSDFSNTTFSATGIVTYNKRFFGGLGYRYFDAVTVLAGIDLPSGIEVAVAYDISTSRMAKVSSGSLEFMLGYSFSLDIDKDNRKYKSVRFL